MKGRMLFLVLLASLGFGLAASLQPASASLPASTQSGYPPPQSTTYPTLPPPPQTPPAPTPTPVEPPSQAASIALAYIARQKNIPAEFLSVVADHLTAYPYLGRQFQAVALSDTRPGGLLYKLLVDLSTNEVIEDVAAIDEAEKQAQAQKYGKFQPALYEQLQTLQDTDVVTVTIWVVAGPGQSLPEREVAAIATLVSKYPEARAAVDKGGQPMDVDDPVLAQRIYNEYVELLKTGTAQRIKPLVEALQTQGVTVRTSDALPAVTASLTKRALLLLAQRGDVSLIGLEADKFHLGLASAVPSDRAPTVWARGYDGYISTDDIVIAIVETDDVDFNSPAGGGSQCPAGDNCFLHRSTAFRAGYWGVYGESGHATFVASAAASNWSSGKGMAYGATIMSAGMTWWTGQYAVDAVSWAFANGADIVNASIGYCTGPALDDVDISFDYYARLYRRTIIASSGNITNCSGDDHVTSPAKGWNVLSVGASEDGDDANWSNDAMAWYSDWRNPSSPHSDRELPEVVAPGTVTAIGPDANPDTPPPGTSFAAPQVAGLAALLIDRNPSLRNWPEAIRAIIMASAVHNIEGPSDIPSGQDWKDGAGAIDAALADVVAQTNCTGLTTTPATKPCWWGEVITLSNFPVGGYRYRHFTASRGERIRAIITWSACVDCPFGSGSLDTDLDLRILDPNNSAIAARASYDNNYELVEFIAPQTGTYTIEMKRYSAAGQVPSSWLGIAWVKDATYLPDLRNQDGWVSEFYVRNDGTLARSFRINYFDPNGNNTPVLNGYDVCNLSPNQTCRILVSDPCCNRIPAGTRGSAIVDGGEDVSVVVTSIGPDADAYEGIPSVPSVSGLGVGTELFVPAHFNNYWGWYSALTVQNIGTAATTVYAYVYDDSGSLLGPYLAWPSAGGSVVYPVLGPWIGSARLTASQPLAVVVRHYTSTGFSMQYPGAISGSTTGYLPSLFREYWGWTSSYQRQAVTAGATSVSYYPGVPGGSGGSGPNCSLNTFGHCEVWMGNETQLGTLWLGSAKVVAAGGSVVTAVHHTSGTGGLGYLGYKAGAKDLILPLVKKNFGGWDASLTVQNVGLVSTNVTVRFYNSVGDEVGSPAQCSLAAGYLCELYSQLPSGLNGSAWVHSDNADVVAVVHESNSNGDGMGYGAVPR